MRRLLILALALFPSSLYSRTPPATPPDAANRANLTIALEPLGDNADGVVARVTFRFAIPSDVPPGVPFVIQGSIVKGGEVVRNFRFPVAADQRDLVRTTQTFSEGETEIEARLLIPLEEQAPVILGKITKKFSIAKTSKVYVATPDEGAEGVFAEGVVPEAVGAVKIRAPGETSPRICSSSTSM